MSNYTLTIQQILDLKVKIFDFNYPIFKEEFRETFEKLFIDHFFLEEIAHETIWQFKHRLSVKLNLVMPYYNKIYESQELEQRILDNYDVTEEINRIVNGDVVRQLSGSTSNKSTNKNLYKDAPKTKINIDKFDVVTNLSKDDHEGSSTNKTSENSNSTNVENYTRTMKGNIGVQTDADAIIKYWASIRNVTLEIFEKELTELFMGVF